MRHHSRFIFWTSMGCLKCRRLPGFWMLIVIVLDSSCTVFGADPRLEVAPSVVPANASCVDWNARMPPRQRPAIVMQVVSFDYIHVERNFIHVMEMNSDFTRDNLYVMCLDEESTWSLLEMGIRCVPLGPSYSQHSRADVWKLRVQVISCLVEEGHDVLMSDADALWLKDPTVAFSLEGAIGSDVVASRGRSPTHLFTEWGSTICMGFVLFRSNAGKTVSMRKFLGVLEELVEEYGDDQTAINETIQHLNVLWTLSGDMRFTTSTHLAMGYIEFPGDSANHGETHKLSISLLPHNVITRYCQLPGSYQRSGFRRHAPTTPISNDTVVAHCHSKGKGDVMAEWMKILGLWLPEGNRRPV